MHRRKTKIVCTLGPATESAEGIASLIEAGMDVVRLNFSHGDREDHRQKIRRIREVSKSVGREVGILQDLGRPQDPPRRAPGRRSPSRGGDRPSRSGSTERSKTVSSPSAIHISSRTSVSASASSSRTVSPSSRCARSRATACSARDHRRNRDLPQGRQSSPGQPKGCRLYGERSRRPRGRARRGGRFRRPLLCPSRGRSRSR